jgi:hypothetical protein
MENPEYIDYVFGFNQIGDAIMAVEKNSQISSSQCRDSSVQFIVAIF